MTIYLAGKVTGDPNYREKFARYADVLDKAGVGHVENPAKLPEGQTTEYYAILCCHMVTDADMVVMLPDWRESKGARLEKGLAEYLGKPVLEFVGGLDG